MSIDYSDGSVVEDKILELVKNAEVRTSETSIAFDQYHEWAVRYHLSPVRANLLRHLNFQNLDVLELGAGMGAVSRFLAENARSLTVVEGTQKRFDVLSERLRDLSNWNGVVANIQDVQVEKKFDVVCVIGVLEYSELYFSLKESGSCPFLAFLNKAASFLKEDGVLILAIENRLGLKYWMGAPEDHTGRLFDGVVGYSLNKSPRTFSKLELIQLLNKAGFNCVDPYYPFPDYKVPTSVLSEEFVNCTPELSAEIASHTPAEAYTCGRVYYAPELLVSSTVASAGLLSEFSNSFLFVGSKTNRSQVRANLLRLKKKSPNQCKEVAWHYSLNRIMPTQTVFKKYANGSLEVSKSIVSVHEKMRHFQSNTLGIILSNSEFTEKVIKKSSLRTILIRSAYYQDSERFSREFTRFLSWSFNRWKLEGPSSATHIAGNALDAIFTNACIDNEGEDYFLFDLEWILDRPIPKTWFIFRNALLLGNDRKVLSSLIGFGSLKELYERVCRDFKLEPKADDDIKRESEFQSQVLLSVPQDLHLRIKDVIEMPIQHLSYPRDMGAEIEMRSEFIVLKQERDWLRSRFYSIPHKVIEKGILGLRKIPIIHGVLRSIFYGAFKGLKKLKLC